MTTDIARGLCAGLKKLITDDVLDTISGGFDLHTHPAPDIVPRSQTIEEAAFDFGLADISGFIVKSHSVPTTTMVASVANGLPSLPLASITLNRSVGGLNPDAVDTAAQMGARIVWLPTKDSIAQHRLEASKPTSSVPSTARKPVHIKEGSRAVDALFEVIDAVVRNSLTLATGHLDMQEIFTVLEVADQRGLKEVIVTHPCLPHLGIPIAAQVEMSRQGALIEHTLNFLATGKVTIPRVLEAIERCGPESTVLTGDLGQPEFRSIAGGLPMWAKILMHNEVSPVSVRRMIVDNTRRAVRQ